MARVWTAITTSIKLRLHDTKIANVYNIYVMYKRVDVETLKRDSEMPSPERRAGSGSMVQ